MVPRKIIVPIVLGVWAVALLVAVHTLVVLPRFIDYYEFYGTQPGFSHATIATAYRHGYAFGAVPLLATLTGGVCLLRRPESEPIRLVYFVASSLVVAFTWLLWTLLSERSLFVLSLPA